MERSTEQTKWRWTQSLSTNRRVKKRRVTRIMLSSSLPGLTRTHTTPRVYRRNTRDRLHVEIDVRTTTAEDTMSGMAKLMGTTEESTSGVTDHRRIHPTSVERNAPISSLSKPIARSKSTTRAFKEKAGYMKRGLCARSRNSVSKDNVRVNERTRRTTF